MGSYNLGTAAGKIIIDAAGASRGFQIAQQAGNAFFDHVNEKADKIRNVGSNLTKVGTAGVAGFGMAIKSAADFEQRISAVGAVSGASSSQMDQIRKTALRIGKDTSFSATEAASAMEELAKAGVSTNDIMGGAADATTALAAAGEISLPRAAEIASASMNNFNMHGKDMPRVADLIAGAANASAIDVGDFGESIKQVGAVANLAGMDFQDTSVAIAEMGQAGIKGSDAGTSLKSMLQNLQPSTKPAAAEFRKLGLITADGSNKFYDAHGKLKKLAEIQQVLKDATQNLTPAQKQMALQTMFGSDAIRAAAIVSKAGTKGYNDMYGAMSKVKATDVANQRLNNLKGSIEKMKGSLETASITVGSVFLPIIRKIVDGVTALIDKFNNMPGGVQKAIAIVVGVVALAAGAIGIFITTMMAAIPVVATFIMHAMMMRLLKSGLGPLREMFTAIRSGAPVLESVGRGLAGAATGMGGQVGRFASLGMRLKNIFMGLRTVASFAFGPWGLAIAIAIAAIVLLYNKCEWFRNIVNAIGSAIKTGFIAAFDGVKRAIQAVIDGFEGAGKSSNPLINIFQNVGKAGKYIWDGLTKIASTVTGVLWPAMQQAGMAIKTYFLDKLQDVWNSIKGSILPAFNQLVKAFSGSGGAIGNFGKILFPLGMTFRSVGAAAKIAFNVIVFAVRAVIVVISALMPIITAVAKIVIDVLGAAFKSLGVIIGAAIRIIAGIINIFVGLFTGDMGRAGEGVKQIFSAIWGAIVGIFKNAWNLIKSVVVDIVTGVIGFFTHLWDVLVGHSIIPDMVNAIIAWFLKLPGAILNLLSSLVSAVIGFFQTMWNGVQTAFSAAWGLIQTALSAAWGGILALAQSIWGGITTFFSSLWNGIQAAWSAIWGLIITFLQDEWRGIQIIAQTVWGLITSFFSSLWTGIQAAWSAAWTAIQIAITTVWNLIVAAARLVWNSLIIDLKALWNVIQAAWSAAWTAISVVIQAVWNGIVAAGKLVWQGLVAFFSVVWSTIQAVWTATWNAIRTIITGVWNGIVAVGRTVWNSLVTFFQAVWNGIQVAWNAAWNTIKAIVTGIWNGIVSSGRAIWSGLTSFFTGVWNGVSGAWTAIWNGIKNAITGVWNGIKAASVAVWNGIKAAVMGAWNGLQSAITNGAHALGSAISAVWNGIRSAAIAAWNGIRSGVMAIWNGLQSAISGAAHALGAALSAVWNGIKSSAIAAWNGLKSGVMGVVNGLKGAITSSVNGIKDAISSAFNAAKNAAMSAIGGLKSAVSNGINDVVGFFRGLIGKIQGALSGAGGALVGIGKNIVQGLVGGIKSMGGSIKDALVGLLPGPLKGFASKLGIASPSKVFKQFGVWTGQGFINGVTSMNRPVSAAVKNLATAATKAATVAVKTVSVSSNKSISSSIKTSTKTASKLSSAVATSVNKASSKVNSASKALAPATQPLVKAKDNILRQYDQILNGLNGIGTRADKARDSGQKALADSLDKQYMALYKKRDQLIAPIDAKIKTLNSQTNVSIDKAKAAKDQQVIQLQKVLDNTEKAKKTAIAGIEKQMDDLDDKYPKTMKAGNDKIEAKLDAQMSALFDKRAAIEYSYNEKIAGLHDQMASTAAKAGAASSNVANALAAAKSKITAATTAAKSTAPAQSQLRTFAISKTPFRFADSLAKDDGSQYERPHVTANITVHNPVAEATSQTTTKQMTRLSTLGVFG